MDDLEEEQSCCIHGIPDHFCHKCHTIIQTKCKQCPCEGYLYDKKVYCYQCFIAIIKKD